MRLTDVPDTIHIGAAQYTVEHVERTKLLGETKQRRTAIILADNQSPASARDTLLHEALHAAMWCAGGERVHGLDDDDEERLIRILSPWLLGIVRDNPALIAYLTA